MSKTIPEIPFTELVERARLLARVMGDSDSDFKRARGAVNDEYVREIPTKEDWQFLVATSAISCTNPYTTGVATINTQATAVTFTSDVTLPTALVGLRIKFNSNANIYDITVRNNSTACTISIPLSGNNNVSSNGYIIFQDVYALAGNFDRFPKNGGLLIYQGGKPKLIKEAQSREEWYNEYVAGKGFPKLCRIVEFGTSGVRHVQISPPPDQAYLLPYDYVLKLDPLRETTAGFVDINSAATAVTGSAGTTRFTEVNTGSYFRIPAFGTGEDSEWYRVVNIANNSSLTLQTSFGLSGATTAAYMLCAAPQMPALLHNAILYGAAMRLMADQNDPLYALMSSMRSATIQEARLLFKSRVYSQQLDLVAEEFLYRR